MTVMAKNGYYFEDLEIGMEASYARTVSEKDIKTFADVTGDRNPIHLDRAYAAKTMFKDVIAHGMLTAGYISAVLGTELPGPGAI
ncbi:MAG: MaoC family dehydratase, partial [Hyphomicrobiaceae bacterium]